MKTARQASYVILINKTQPTLVEQETINFREFSYKNQILSQKNDFSSLSEENFFTFVAIHLDNEAHKQQFLPNSPISIHY